MADLYERLARTLAEIDANYQIIFVDDASPDQCWTMIDQWQSVDEHVKGIQLMRNFGQQRAVLCGLAHAEGEYVVTMDADLQQSPEDIPRLYARIAESDLDAVVGSYPSKQHGGLRRLGTRLVRLYYTWTFKVPSTLELTSFRIMRKQVCEEMVRIHHQNPVVGYLMLIVTRRVENVPVAHAPRQGKSSYGLGSLLAYFSVMLFDYSDLPLRLVALGGGLFAMGSFVVGSIYLLKYLSGGIGVSGFTTIVLLICFLFGLTAIGIAVLGAYLVRILRGQSPEPPYIIRQ